MGPGRTPLKVKGMFTATVRKRNKTTIEGIYVVEGLCTPLLSWPAATAPQLVARLDNADSEENIVQEFPKLFFGQDGGQEEHCTQTWSKTFLTLSAETYLPPSPSKD